MNSDKTSVIGRILSIIFGIIALCMVLGKWLDIYQVPIIMGNYDECKYSLFEVQDFLSSFNLYVGSEKIEMYSDFLLFGGYTVVISNIIAMILSLFGTKPAKVVSVMSNIVSVILAGVVIGFIYKTNSYVEERTYGNIEELLRLTAKPWLLVLFSVLQSVCLCFKATPNQFGNFVSAQRLSVPQKQCVNCGAYMASDAMFCNRCGAKAEKLDTADTYCKNCGTKMIPGTAFCPSCGTKA